MRLYVRPPTRPSHGARAIADALGARLLRRNNSRYRPRRGDVIINWGNPFDMEYAPAHMLNDPRAVHRAVNKELTWIALEDAGVPTVEWTQFPEIARQWLIDGHRVMTRDTLHGTQGRGIKVYSYGGTEWTDDYNAFCHAPRSEAYVKVFGRVPARVTEYRVAVCNGQVIDRQKKMRRRDYEGTPNPYVRNHEKGWVYARQFDSSAVPDAVAVAAIRAVGLDFGAVDLAVAQGEATCVYEINTAPGLEGSTIGAYADALVHADR